MGAENPHINMDRKPTLPPYQSTMGDPPQYAHTNAVIKAGKLRALDEVRTLDLCLRVTMN